MAELKKALQTGALFRMSAKRSFIQLGKTNFLQQARPFCLLEACQDSAAVHDYGTLYEHTVGRKQTKLFVLGHGGELFLKIHGFIKQAAGVEKALERQAAHFIP